MTLIQLGRADFEANEFFFAGIKGNRTAVLHRLSAIVVIDGVAELDQMRITVFTVPVFEAIRNLRRIFDARFFESTTEAQGEVFIRAYGDSRCHYR